MVCSQCRGLVTWQGPLRELTHTQCQNCGGINCQIIDPVTDSDSECEEILCPLCSGSGMSTPTQRCICTY